MAPFTLAPLGRLPITFRHLFLGGISISDWFKIRCANQTMARSSTKFHGIFGKRSSDILMNILHVRTYITSIHPGSLSICGPKSTKIFKQELRTFLFDGNREGWGDFQILTELVAPFMHEYLTAGSNGHQIAQPGALESFLSAKDILTFWHLIWHFAFDETSDFLTILYLNWWNFWQLPYIYIFWHFICLGHLVWNNK